MLFADDQWIELARGGVERIDRRVDAQLGNLTAQHQSGVEVSEGGGGRRVGQVISWHVNGLERRDRAGAGRSDALLQGAHFRGQRRLVTHGGRHPAKQRGHFGTSQRVAVDVIDEEQHVTAFVAEEFGHGQTGQRNAQPVARRLAHLTVNQCHFVQHAAFLHLVIEVVALTGTLADAGKHRVAAVFNRDVADQLHQRHRLADAGAAEQADLAALGDRHDQVDDLDTGLQDFHRGSLISIGRSFPVDGHMRFRVDRAGLVHRFAQHIHDAAQSGFTHRNRDGCAGITRDRAALQSVSGAHRNGPDDAVTQLLLHLEGKRRGVHLDRVIDLGQRSPRELHVYHRADDLYDFSFGHGIHS